MNSVTLQAYNNGVTEYVMRPSINFTDLFLTKTIFKIGSLNLFRAETPFRYCQILRFPSLKLLV